MEATKAKKSAQTRRKLAEVSLQLFVEQGFEQTTMRDIAKAADLAPSAAYYYFPSKEALVFDFYDQTFDLQLAQANEALARESKLDDRLAAVITAHLQASEPYHALSRSLFRVAADPRHPLSPFSPQSRTLRERNIEQMHQVLEGTKIPPSLAKTLPEVLWLYKMAVLAYWIHDPSPDRQKTYELVQRSSQIVAQLVQISSYPVARRFAAQVLKLFDEYKWPSASE